MPYAMFSDCRVTPPIERSGNNAARVRQTIAFRARTDLFGFYASYIAKAFFPSESEVGSLMLTFMTFGAGFLMRPLGAIFLGPMSTASGGGRV